jgi:hypothetical protein
MMNTKKTSLFIVVILVAAAFLWTSAASADGGGFPTATPTVTSTPEPSNTPQPTETQAATESSEELEEFLQELEQVEGEPTETQELDAVPMSDTPSDEGGARSWLAIFLIGTTILFVIAGLVAVFFFYQRSRAGASPQ